MLGWFLLGMVLGAAVITLCVTYLDKNVAKNKLKASNMKKGVIKEIINSGNVTHIRLDAIDEYGNEKQVQFEAQEYNASEIRKGTTIFV